MSEVAEGGREEMTDRKKLAFLLSTSPHLDVVDGRSYEKAAEDLIANGVAFAKDTDVPSKWISVEDGMPEPMAWVLCACRANIIEVLRYDRNIDGWGTAGPNRGYMKSFVTHWMPLPEPPEPTGGAAE